MSTDRDVTRIVRSWLDEGVTQLPDRVLDLVLDQVPATPQRRAGWLARRFPIMNTYLKLGLSAAVVVLALIVGISYFSRSNIGHPPNESPSPSAAASAAASAVPLARGEFASHGGNIQLDVTGEGPNVTGSMTYADVGGESLGGFVVDPQCTRTTPGGLIMIAGPITESTKGYIESAPVGTNIALILQPGSPVSAEIFVESPDPHEPDCGKFLDSIADERPPGALEPITGAVELNP